jgi:hypothetical protein
MVPLINEIEKQKAGDNFKNCQISFSELISINHMLFSPYWSYDTVPLTRHFDTDRSDWNLWTRNQTIRESAPFFLKCKNSPFPTDCPFLPGSYGCTNLNAIFLYGGSLQLEPIERQLKVQSSIFNEGQNGLISGPSFNIEQLILYFKFKRENSLFK